ncbi:STAS domain-containing protein [Streptomyces sp. NPDC058644]|uniref:STAS domain-containing protein n=1 Tax=unclassified Streptomyces TaxID=2593676 RepID=UPI003652B875
MKEDTQPRMALRHLPTSPTVVQIYLTGELDPDITALLRETIVYLASRPDDHRWLLLDLSALTYCDNTGLYTLLGICQALDAVGITVTITETGTIARAAINRAGLQHRLPLRVP